MSSPHSEYDIVLTNTAKKKIPRMHGAAEMRQIIRRNNTNVVWERDGGSTGDHDGEEYHLISYDGYALVVSPKHDTETIVVITQMHQHIDYHHDDRFHAVQFMRFPDDRSSSDPQTSHHEQHVQSDPRSEQPTD